MGDSAILREGVAKLAAFNSVPTRDYFETNETDRSYAQAIERMAEGEGFEPPRGFRPGGFQVHCLTS